MAALTQTYQQQTGTATMLSGRTTTSAGMMQAGQPNGHHQYTTSAPRGGGGYRGSTVPVHYQPAPNLNQSLAWQQYGAFRTSSSSAIPTQTFDPSLVQRSHRTNPSVTNMALIPAYSPGHGSHGSSSGHSSSHGSSHSSTRDDPVKSQSRSAASTQRPPLALIPSSVSQPAVSPGGTPKNTPDRYRRPSNSNTQHGRTQISNPPLSPGNQNLMYHAPSGSRSVPNLAASPAQAPGTSMDDSQLHRRPSPDEAKKMRRRSVHTIQSTDSFRPLLKPENAPRPGLAVIPKNTSDRGEKSPQSAPKKPVHVRKGSSDSASSSRSSHSRSASVSHHFHRRSPSPW